MAFERRFLSRLALAALVSLSAPLVPQAALAQPDAAEKQPSAADRETARSLMDEGVDREEAKDFKAALKAYQGAHALVRLPMTGVAVARMQAALGLLVEALDSTAEVKQMPHRAGEGPAYAKARDEADELTATVFTRTPSIQVTVTEAQGAVTDGVKVWIDGVELPAAAAFLPRKVNPGKHTVAAVATGYDRAEQDVTVPEGKVFPVSLPLKPLATGTSVGNGPPRPPPPGGGPSPLVFVGFGVGAAGIIAGAITGGISFGKTSTLKDQCPDGHCAPALQGEIDKANTIANVSNVCFAVGGAGVVAGVVGLLISRGSREEKTPAARLIRVLPAVGPGGVAVSGTF